MIRSVRDRRIRIYSFFFFRQSNDKAEKFIFDLKQLRGATRISNPRVGWIPSAAKTPGDQGGQRRPLNAFYFLCAESAAYICPAESIAGFSFLSVGGGDSFFSDANGFVFVRFSLVAN